MTGVKDIAIVPAPSSELSIFQQLASDPNASVEKIERLMALWERAEARKAEQAFNSAMSEAQAKMRPIHADASNPQTRSRYASYAALDKALRPIYTGLGFGLSFDTGADAPEDYVRVLCYVTHTGGHARTYRIDMPADGKGAKGGDVMTKTHATGSGVSYGMRYLLKMVFNVSVGEDDDDGNKASQMKAPASAPVGYDTFMEGLEAVSIEGTEALMAAWKSAGVPLRAHLTKMDPQKWGAIKAVAAMADKRTKVAK